MTTDRYSRQRILPVVGDSGQRALAGACVVVVGCGATGGAAADLLVRAGVGHVRLVDRDIVELSNLQRQVLFDEADARDGMPKSVAAAARLGRVNSSVRVEPLVGDLVPLNADRLLTGASVIVDGTDNFESRYVLNDYSVKHGVPLVYGGVLGTVGAWGTFRPGGACLRCVLDEAPAPGTLPTCETAGVLGMAVALVGAMQARDVLTLCVGGQPPAKLVREDVWTGSRTEVSLAAPRAGCACCGGRNFEHLSARHAGDSLVLCGRDAVQVTPSGDRRLDLRALGARLAALGEVVVREHMLTVTPRGEHGIEVRVFADARAIVRGTTKPEVARGVYARVVGA